MTDDASIEIEPYDAGWPDKFRVERELLGRILQPWLTGPIEHVGSTAIPGLAAKPVIDIMAAVHDLDSSRPAFEVLCDARYCHARYRDDVMHWFCKPGPARRTHHLHLVPFESALWLERLAFRDLLRADVALAREYEALKYRLAAAHPHDREAYTQAKSPFIERALAAGGVRLSRALNERRS